jgi:hypothetical protein
MTEVSRRSLLCAITLVTSAACGMGLPSPGSELNTGQALLELNEAMVQLREDNAVIQAQVDSLREVVARQDTTLRVLAAQSGVPVPPPS